ncbi:glycosyltransferase family 39 protein [Aphanothece sacrum]|uniref:Inner membrane protein n=1 Tax=Aphanothece sacrum FPU1 TaxID=1920663 RepID=A0A401ID19_APHSA|nr:glycosyltransferase family 39 protein [Aphanothece sacrum]GBF79079.1 inner membrane protein [Aphanothece sacrum FPU1]GBF85125.1 inner membrane protein [Aphanothece sacrum FPU3]
MKLSKQTLIITLLMALGMAVILRIVNLGSREFWYDEVLSLLLSTGQKNSYQHPTDMPVLLSNYINVLKLPIENNFNDVAQTFVNFLKGLVAEPHPPLFFIEQHFWLRLWGNSEVAMRSLVALFSLGSIGCAYGLGRCLLGNQGGLLFAALLGLNPYYLFHSLNVRMYASLVFWTLLSSWSLLELISRNSAQRSLNSLILKPVFLNSKWFWTFLLIISVSAGFMTFYYFAFWLIVLGALILLLNPQRWWQYALYLFSSIIITIPWLWWGTRQQLRNADLGRFATTNNWLEAMLKHSQEFLDVLGIHLLLGDWVSIAPSWLITLIGIIALTILVWCIWSLWYNQEYRLLTIGLLLGIFPLLLMLTFDIITQKFTLGFGWGRSVIFVLPGLLLLVTIYLEKAAKKWKDITIISLLIIYLTVNITDFSLRSRSMFQQISNIIEKQPDTPTLIVMNSQAWGHVLRLAYYLPSTSPVSLLAQNSDELASKLEKTLQSTTNQYERIIWLDSQRPVWGKPTTEKQKEKVKAMLEKQFKLEESKTLLGTWELDDFTFNLYQNYTKNNF